MTGKDGRVMVEVVDFWPSADVAAGEEGRMGVGLRADGEGIAGMRVPLSDARNPPRLGGGVEGAIGAGVVVALLTELMVTDPVVESMGFRLVGELGRGTSGGRYRIVAAGGAAKVAKSGIEATTPEVVDGRTSVELRGGWSLLRMGVVTFWFSRLLSTNPVRLSASPSKPVFCASSSSFARSFCSLYLRRYIACMSRMRCLFSSSSENSRTRFSSANRTPTGESDAFALAEVGVTICKERGEDAADVLGEFVA